MDVVPGIEAELAVAVVDPERGSETDQSPWTDHFQQTLLYFYCQLQYYQDPRRHCSEDPQSSWHQCVPDEELLVNPLGSQRTVAPALDPSRQTQSQPLPQPSRSVSAIWCSNSWLIDRSWYHHLHRYPLEGYLVHLQLLEEASKSCHKDDEVESMVPVLGRLWPI